MEQSLRNAGRKSECAVKLSGGMQDKPFGSPRRTANDTISTIQNV
jgi:hypothetical protein